MKIYNSGSMYIALPLTLDSKCLNGIYAFQVVKGEIMGKEKQLALVIGLVVVGFIAVYFFTKRKVADADGDTKCKDGDLYTYIAGKWVMTERDAEQCKLPLDPIPPEPVPPELPPGFEIDKIEAEPPIVILGNPVNIKVAWCAPGLIEDWTNRELSLQCVINGETLQHTWTYTGSVTTKFKYTPTSIGTYTATILDDGIKFNCPDSVLFEVVKETIGPFYSPFGEVCKYLGFAGTGTGCKGANYSYGTLSELADWLASSSWTRSGGIWEGKTVGGAGRSSDVVYCPYCSKLYTACVRPLGLSCSYSSRLAVVYDLLEHIQVIHPEYPLTSPREL